uniref:Uncharacterized protein n=1 Tax=Stomoxys calcitrans TaxID=35570 RepID=A0A1I8PWK0_STOCA
MICWKVFVFVIFYVNLGSSLAARQKCHTEEELCIQTCCNSTDFYHSNVAKCQLTWRYFNLSLESQLSRFNGNHRYMKLLVKFWHDVNVPCLKSEDVEISWQNPSVNLKQISDNTPEYCFSRNYNNNSNKYDLKPLHCNTGYSWHTYSRYIIIS